LRLRKKGGGIVKTFVVILWICSMIYLVGAIVYIVKHWDAIKQVWQQAKAEAQAEMEQKERERERAKAITRTLWTYDRRGRKKYTTED
jgi:arginine exporter protein ArgO